MWGSVTRLPAVPRLRDRAPTRTGGAPPRHTVRTSPCQQGWGDVVPSALSRSQCSHPPRALNRGVIPSGLRTGLPRTPPKGGCSTHGLPEWGPAPARAPSPRGPSPRDPRHGRRHRSLPGGAFHPPGDPARRVPGSGAPIPPFPAGRPRAAGSGLPAAGRGAPPALGRLH